MKKSRSVLIEFTIIACACAIIARYMQLIRGAINFDTGFFDYTSGFLRHIHYIVLALAFGGLIAIAVVEKKKRTTFFTKRLGHLDQSDTFMCGIMMLLAAFALFFTAFQGRAEVETSDAVIAVFGSGAYTAAGLILLIKKRALPSVGICFLFLAMYYVIDLVRTFLGNYVLLNMSEHLVRLIFTTFLALFFVTAGRMFLRAESKSTRVKTCIFGFFSAIVVISEILSKMLFWFGSPVVARTELQTTSFVPPDMQFSAEAIVLLTLLICFARRKSERVKSDKEA